MDYFKLYKPNGKHGVNTLTCFAKYDKDGNPIYPQGWEYLTPEQLEGLENKTLAWDNGKIIPYIETSEDIEQNAREQAKKLAEEELVKIERWFNMIYDAQIKQAERCKRLGIEYDNKYGTVEELDAKAVKNAARIRELMEAL